MGQPEVSIILVNYKTPVLIAQCIESVVQHTTGCSYEIIVVDNCSGDNSEALVKAAFPQVRWHNMAYNSGFARGNNKGIEMAQGGYILILNSDTLLHEDAIAKSLMQYRLLEKNDNLGLLGCKITATTGGVLGSVHKGFLSFKHIITANALTIALLRQKAKPRPYQPAWYNTSHFADHLSGAFLLFNRTRIKGRDLLMDEDFFLYSEDVEWCYRLQQKGFKHYYYAATAIQHIDGGSHTNSNFKQAQILLSQLLFIYKTKGGLALRAYSSILKFNWWLDDLLNKRKGPMANPAETEAAAQRAWKRELVKKYTAVILQNYGTRPGSATHFLKYEG